VHNFFGQHLLPACIHPTPLGGAESIVCADVKRARQIFPDRREVAVLSTFFAFRANEPRNFHHRRTFAQCAKPPDAVDAR
jgi:hypothetical protein